MKYLVGLLSILAIVAAFISAFLIGQFFYLYFTFEGFEILALIAPVEA